MQVDVDNGRFAREPFAGVVTKRLADEGDMLNAQQPVLELIETGRLEARVGVPSALISTLDRERYYVMSADGNDVTARIRDVIRQVDPATRTQTVVLDIDDAFVDQLADGQLIRLKFEEPQAVHGFRVPLTALAAAARGLWTVYVVESESDESAQQVVKSRTVEVLHTDGDHAVIRGSVYEGEHIVLEGVHRVTPGQVVTADER
ncbi:MAG: efflux RND transporter periplasmic adaptor subunit [Planctomycetaceae bacterium]